MGYADQIKDRLNNVKPVENRVPFIKAGNHPSLIIEYIETYIDKKLGESIEQLGFSARAVFTVEQSTTHAPGSRVTKIWNLFKPSKFPTQPTDADHFVDFICKLQGCKLGEHGPAMNALINKQAEGGQLEAQLARGMRIAAIGNEVGKTNDRGERYVAVAWDTFTKQDNAMVAATRAQLDTTNPYVPRQSQQQQVQPPNYGNVPHAAAQPQQFQQQYVQQPVPQAAQSQYVQQPMQQYTQTAPQQFQVQPVPQQPMQVQQPAQPQPMQTAPAGGFLSMLPKPQ